MKMRRFLVRLSKRLAEHFDYDEATEYYPNTIRNQILSVLVDLFETWATDGLTRDEDYKLWTEVE